MRSLYVNSYVHPQKVLLKKTRHFSFIKLDGIAHPTISKLRNILNIIHVPLAPCREHQNAFPEVRLVGFKKGKT